ncbi:MAG: nickel-type superoxide dismutase maturation protease [Spirochaeta sp.]|nr:nickel-type superoxide dismutase maturation protease [Spirochaeta sp.]
MRFPYLTAFATVGVFAALLSLSVELFAVDGDSMLPKIAPGEVLVVNRLAFAFGPPRPGDVLLFRHPDNGQPTVKRLAGYHRHSLMELRGDNARSSIDSRHYGGVSTTALIGKVIFVGRHHR